MKTLLLVLAAVFGSAHSANRWFSVQVRGTLLCHDQPYANQPIDIFHASKQMDYTDFMSHFTGKDGYFDLSAKLSTDDYMISPYLVIRHRCWENPQVPHRCNRKIVLAVPHGNVTVAEVPTKLFDMGTVDLRFKHKSEVIVKCGVA